MSPPKTSIVVTTIFEPEFLNGYLREIDEAEQRDSVTIRVIIDRKTPDTVPAACASARKLGYQVECPTLEAQQALLTRWSLPESFVPWDTDNRRNIGFLASLEDGCEVLISIDDDNFTTHGSHFLREHQLVGRPTASPVIQTSDGWFNICDLITGWGEEPIYARGFPYYAQRESRTVSEQTNGESPPIAMNAGLWLDEPDVDAVYRLCRRPKVRDFQGASVVLPPDVWTPVNTQNTSLTREAALTYYYVKMGFPLKGLTIDRFGDILSGYLTQKCIKHLGFGIRLGTPIVDHRRTPHNFFKDLYHELAGIVLIEELLPWLMEVKLEGDSALEVYSSLASQLEVEAERFRGFIWDDGGRDFLRATAKNMQIWTDCVRRIAF